MTEVDDLRADCSRCFALCCVAPAFARSSDFAIDKPAGTPCPNVAVDHRCTIHDRLRPEGFAGCAAYDCFGAGQRLAQQTFGGRDWRTHAAVVEPMMATFPVLRQLHELLWYLLEAAAWRAAAAVRSRIDAAVRRVDDAAALPPSALAGVDVAAVRAETAPLLREASALVRAGLGGCDRSGADLAGADLRTADLVGADLRGAYLLGARLPGVDLRQADLLGADLRGADVRGAHLRGALFVTQVQLSVSRGDAATTIPERLTRPDHWAR